MCREQRKMQPVSAMQSSQKQGVKQRDAQSLVQLVLFSQQNAAEKLCLELRAADKVFQSKDQGADDVLAVEQVQSLVTVTWWR